MTLETIAHVGKKLFSFREDIFSESMQGSFDRIISRESLSIPIKCKIPYST